MNERAALDWRSAPFSEGQSLPALLYAVKHTGANDGNLRTSDHVLRATLCPFVPSSGNRANGRLGCTGCQPSDLDTTIGAFQQLAQSALGRVDVTWAWLEPVATGT